MKTYMQLEEVGLEKVHEWKVKLILEECGKRKFTTEKNMCFCRTACQQLAPEGTIGISRAIKQKLKKKKKEEALIKGNLAFEK